MIFLLLFLLFFGSTYYYIYTKVKAVVALGPTAKALSFAVMFILILSPFLLDILFNYNISGATAIAYFVYIWLAFVFIFLCSSLVIEFWRMLVRAGMFLTHKKFSYLLPSNLFVLLAPFLVAVCICTYGFFAARDIRPEVINISSPKITKKFTIAQISDLHLSAIVNEYYLQKVLAIVEDAKPDLLVSTGDLIDAMGDDFSPLAMMFAGVKPPYGKYAVTGNHEFYHGLDKALSFTEESGFAMLREKAVPITNEVVLAGVDDAVLLNTKALEKKAEDKLLKTINPRKFVILLKHRPTIIDSSLPFFDLQLSGHTHQGQIFPFGLFMGFLFKYWIGGLYHPGHADLYVNRGAGTWGPPIRFLAPPEVAIINLLPTRR
ncbi:MAG: metallophosphoesterase [Gammaproteobacteria bacterium]|nr:metallophosphoesterase [Gammaproteobacteria bacterium]